MDLCASVLHFFVTTDTRKTVDEQNTEGTGLGIGSGPGSGTGLGSGIGLVGDRSDVSSDRWRAVDEVLTMIEREALLPPTQVRQSYVIHSPCRHIFSTHLLTHLLTHIHSIHAVNTFSIHTLNHPLNPPSQPHPDFQPSLSPL